MSFVNHALSRNQILSSGLLLRRCVVFHRVFSPGFEPRLGAFCTGFTAQDLSGPLVPKALVQETARSPDSPGLMVKEDLSSVGPSSKSTRLANSRGGTRVLPRWTSMRGTQQDSASCRHGQAAKGTSHACDIMRLGQLSTRPTAGIDAISSDSAAGGAGLPR